MEQVIPDINILVVDEEDVTAAQKDQMRNLQISCFSDQVTVEECEEDFICDPEARVLAYAEDELIACSSVFLRTVVYENHEILLGGFGPCTRENYRNMGIGTRVCRTAMQYLIDKRCDIGFLSVDTSRESHLLYERLGFHMLSTPFIYANIRGELKESDGGMIVPLCSQEIFSLVINGQTALTLTPEIGYW
jgi:GNAT superfamily N-acetyltransferase